MSNFLARTITGLSMVFLLIAAMIIHPLLLALFLLAITTAGILEFYSLFRGSDRYPQKAYGISAGIILFLIITIKGFYPDTPWMGTLFALIPAILFTPFVLEIFRKKPNPLVNIALTLTGMIYVALPLALLNVINGPDALRFLGAPVFLLGLFLLTWIYDTTAYLYGKQFGRHKFFERISPKKTWEGTIAGTLVTLLASVPLHLIIPGIGLIDWLVLAILIILFGTLGDLIESLIKRSLNLKDSGALLPGHGGILDRFDSVLISAPFIISYLLMRNLIHL